MTTAFAFVLLGLVVTQPEAPAADPLEAIRSLLDNEAEAVQAVREFDRREIGLLNWDIELAEQYRLNGEPQLAEEAQARARKRLAQVSAAYDLLLGRYPENPLAMTYYGELAYDYLGKGQEAVELWERALRLDPDIAAAHNNLGLHLCHHGEYKSGLDHVHRALELDSDNPDILYNLAQLYLVHFPEVERIYGKSRQTIYNDAMAMSKKAAELNPADYSLLEDYAVNFFAGVNFGVAVDWRVAADAWAEARTRARNKVERFYTWLNEGRAAMNGEDMRRAKRSFEEALELDPNSEVAKRLRDRADNLRR